MQSWLFHVQEGARKAFVNTVARKSRCSSREVATASLKESYVCEKKSAIKSHHTGRQWVRNSSTVCGLGTVPTCTVTVLQEQTAIECLKLPDFDKQYCRLVWWKLLTDGDMVYTVEKLPSTTPALPLR